MIPATNKFHLDIVDDPLGHEPPVCARAFREKVKQNGPKAVEIIETLIR